MEINLIGTKGYYTVRDNNETLPQSSILASHVKVTSLGLGFGLICLVFFALSSLTTSLNPEIGSLSMAALFCTFLMSQFITPSLIDILGAKTCAVGSGASALFLAVSYFYPSWFTLMPSSIGMGLGFGLLYAAAGTIKNDEVRKCAERFKVDPMTYQGRFSSIIVGCGLGLSSVLAGTISFAILYSNRNETNTSGQAHAQECSLPASTDSVHLTIYYILVAVLTGAAAVSIVTLSTMRGAAYHQCSVCSFGLRDIFRKSFTRAVKVLKQACTPAYGLVFPLRLNQGFAIAYFFGVFTKMYITECVGVEFVGASVIVWGSFATLGSFGSGWLLRHTTGYAMVLVCIGGLEVGSLVFLIAWERQPSFAVIFAMSAVFGLSYGLNATVALAYSGTAPGDHVIGYSVFVIGLAGSETVQYFLSEFISAETNLYVILVITILAVPLFTIADIHYGSGTSRNICGKKKLAVAVVENGNLQSEPVDSNKDNGYVSRTRRESTLPLVGNGSEGSVSDPCSTPVMIEEDQVFNDGIE